MDAHAQRRPVPLLGGIVGVVTGSGRDMRVAGRINLYMMFPGHVVLRGLLAAGAGCLVWDGMDSSAFGLRASSF